VISLAGQPERQPNLKKPTALRGAVGVWDCENSDRSEVREEPEVVANRVSVWLRPVQRSGAAWIMAESIYARTLTNLSIYFDTFNIRLYN